VELLDPDVVLRADFGEAAAAGIVPLIRGADQVAARAQLFSRSGVSSRHALVNGAAGVLSWRDGKLFAVLAFTVAHGKIVAIDVLADPERLSGLEGVAG